MTHPSSVCVAPVCLLCFFVACGVWSFFFVACGVFFCGMRSVFLWHAECFFCGMRSVFLWHAECFFVACGVFFCGMRCFFGGMRSFFFVACGVSFLWHAECFFCGMWQEGVFYFYGRHVYFLGWTPLRVPPPPNLPSSAPTQTKRVPICSFFKQAPVCILIKT